ncbi:MAG: hypothetical protein WKF97_07560 [Chitinophagaceae bacterium]
MKPALLVISFLTFFSLTGKAGRDFYEIYLNKKLIVKQHAGEFSATLMNLPLENAKESDQISIFFFHCNAKGAGKGRTIVARNEQNNIVKEWKFADPSGSDGSMIIPVKDLLELRKKYAHSNLHLYYTSSQELPKGMMLAAINQADKKVSRSIEYHLPILIAGLMGMIMLSPAPCSEEI